MTIFELKLGELEVDCKNNILAILYIHFLSESLKRLASKSIHRSEIICQTC